MKSLIEDGLKAKDKGRPAFRKWCNAFYCVECYDAGNFYKLAWVLRDAAVQKDIAQWHRAINWINVVDAPSSGYTKWWQDAAQPEHWIIAAIWSLR